MAEKSHEGGGIPIKSANLETKRRFEASNNIKSTEASALKQPDVIDIPGFRHHLITNSFLFFIELPPVFKEPRFTQSR